MKLVSGLVGLVAGLFVITSSASAERSRTTQIFASICLQSDAQLPRAVILADQAGWKAVTDGAPVPGGMKVSPGGVVRRKTEAGVSYFLVLDLLSGGPDNTMWMCNVLSAPPQKDVRADLREMFSADPVVKMNVNGSEAWSWIFIVSPDGGRRLIPSLTSDAVADYRSHRKIVINAIEFPDRSAIGMMAIPAARTRDAAPPPAPVELLPLRP